ncbi:MAG: protein disulfide isomerase family protein [Candidatus Micrarchaeia archaeon]
MDQSEQSGFDRAQYLIGFVILAAVLLLGVSAYFSANSAKGTAAKLDNALDSASAGNFHAGAPLQNGSAANVSAAGQQNNSNATAGGNGTLPAAGLENGTALQPAQANGTAQNGTGQTAQNGTAAVQQNVSEAAKKEVVLDFLYADWCGHCQNMKPIVAELASSLPPDRFEVRYWNEASRGKEDVAAIYTEYTDKEYFRGFPTFVANGNDPRVGEMSGAIFKSWVCSKFSAPKPAGC